MGQIQVKCNINPSKKLYFREKTSLTLKFGNRRDASVLMASA